LVSPPQFASGTEFYAYNLEKAAGLLDEAGWVDSDNNGFRDKDGEELGIVFQTAANPVRQDVQRIIRSSLEEIGVEVEIRIIDSSVFYGTDVENSVLLPMYNLSPGIVLAQTLVFFFNSGRVIRWPNNLTTGRDLIAPAFAGRIMTNFTSNRR
jgi:ABC-type transport system substrate-binding protein